MGAVFTAASSTRLTHSGLTSTAGTLPLYPFTIGMWVYSFTSAPLVESMFWSTTNEALTCGRISAAVTTGGAWRLAAEDGISAVNVSGGTVVANQWYHLTCRFITSNLFRAHVLNLSDITQLTFSGAPAITPTLTAIHLGARGGSTPSGFFDGIVAEYWRTNTDILATGIATATCGIIQNIAFNGPWSMAHIAKEIVEYQSFRESLETFQHDGNEVYFNALYSGYPRYNNTNNVIVGPHPPIAYRGRPQKSDWYPYNLGPIFAGITQAAAASGASFSWGAVWRNRLMMVGHGR